MTKAERIEAMQKELEVGTMNPNAKRFTAFHVVSPTFFVDENLRVSDVEDKAKFRALHSVVALDLEEAFMFCQGEVWSPEGEANFLVSSLGLKHTSLSVGDVLFDEEEGVYYQVLPVEFREVKK